MSEYTPSEGHVRDRYVSYEALDRPGPEPDAEFDRFLARVRRDAARSALDGYADALNRNRSAAVWEWPEFVTDVREWAADLYPEETPLPDDGPAGEHPGTDLPTLADAIKALGR